MTISSERGSYLTKVTQLVRDLYCLCGSRDRAFNHDTFWVDQGWEREKAGINEGLGKQEMR